MKKIKVIITILIAFIAINSKLAFGDIPKTLYGYDDRHEALNYYDQMYIDHSRSVGGLVYNSKLLNTTPESNFFDFEKVLAIRAFNLCPTERFGYQPILPRCTAFLVSEDIMITAGHCITTQEECQSMSVVFDFDLGVNQIPKNNVYKCVELLEHKLEDKLLKKYDYSIFRISRKSDRTPFKIATSLKIKKDRSVITIGHPMGLPLKTSDSAKIIKTYFSHFTTNLDTYAGNSGSPVFDQETGVILGLVSYGQEDWNIGADPATGFACRKSVIKPDESKDGERIFRLDRIKSLKKIINR